MGDKIALISDLHSNMEALEGVLKDINEQGVEDIVCLGDMIGYGPNPREMLRHAFNWRWSLRGNHEDALLFLALDFNHEAAQAIDWTRDQINYKDAPKDENHKMWNFIAVDRAGLRKRYQSCAMVHLRNVRGNNLSQVTVAHSNFGNAQCAWLLRNMCENLVRK